MQSNGTYQGIDEATTPKHSHTCGLMSSLTAEKTEAGFSYYVDCAEDLTSVVANALPEQTYLPSGRIPDAGSQRPVPEFIGGNDVSVSTDSDRI